MLESLPLTDWTGPFDAQTKTRALSALESGAVLFFPNLAFTLQDSEKQFLDAGVSDGKAKNISLDHTTGKMQASSLSGLPNGTAFPGCGAVNAASAAEQKVLAIAS